MPRFNQILLVFVLSMLVGFSVLLMVSFTWALVWIMVHLIMFLYLMFYTDTRSGLTLLSLIIPRTHLVHTMDHDGEVRHVLAYGEPGQVLHAHRYWLSEIGEIQLHPNGYVSGPSYVYFWEPTDPNQLVAMHLTYDCIDWHKLGQMSWTHRDDYRQQLKSQIKLNHESHI